jgi:hypothetical protein
MNIDLGNGKVTIIDDSDWAVVRKHYNRKGVCTQHAPCNLSWYATKGGYARAGGGDNPRVFLHRLIMQCPPGFCVDHINGNRLDNRRCNLRLCNIGENSRNTRKRPQCRCLYKGVVFNDSRSKTKPYRSRIRINRKLKYLGSFQTQLEAALAYDDAAINAFGSFAMLNFPERHAAELTGSRATRAESYTFSV